MIEVTAQLNNLRISPKKVRLVTDLIKGLDVEVALAQLEYVHKGSASAITKLLKSALANAQHNKDISADKLMVKHVVVNEALALKRWKPAAHGAAHPFKKRGSNVRLVLGLKPGVKLSESKKKDEKKKEVETKKVATAEDAKRTPSHVSGGSSEIKSQGSKGVADAPKQMQKQPQKKG